MPEASQDLAFRKLADPRLTDRQPGRRCDRAGAEPVELGSSRPLLSQHTVSNHLRHAFAKLDVTSRVELARLAAIHDNRVG